MKVLGIDTALRCTGLGVVEARSGRFVALEYGLVRNSARAPHSACLGRLHAEVSAWLARHQPAAAALEGGFFFKNAQTALILGEARGAVIAACAGAGVPIFEYAPRLAKQAVTGFGGAQKDAVGKMIRALLALTEAPPEDAADALALAFCHLQHQGGLSPLRPTPL